MHIAVSSPDHSTLVEAVKAAELVDALSNAGPFTVFAPVNAAFDKLPAGTVEGLLKPDQKTNLQDILEFHVAVGVYKTENFKRWPGSRNGKWRQCNVCRIRRKSYRQWREHYRFPARFKWRYSCYRCSASSKVRFGFYHKIV